MPDVAKLKKKAAELELKKQFDKALAVYIEILHSYDKSDDEIDVGLYNRVGDIYLKQGNVADAVDYYEQAVDRYAESGFFNNAIALCNKILRNSPGRASIYYKLGKISAQKGFVSDAKINFLEYADRMQKAGKIDEAFRALKEFADLCPDQDDVRLLLADQLSKQERGSRSDRAAPAAVRAVYRAGSRARGARDGRSHEGHRPGGRAEERHGRPKQKAGDLVFLDVTFDEKPRPGAPRRASARAACRTSPRPPPKAAPNVPPPAARRPPRRRAVDRPSVPRSRRVPGRARGAAATPADRGAAVHRAGRDRAGRSRGDESRCVAGLPDLDRHLVRRRLAARPRADDDAAGRRARGPAEQVPRSEPRSARQRDHARRVRQYFGGISPLEDDAGIGGSASVELELSDTEAEAPAPPEHDLALPGELPTLAFRKCARRRRYRRWATISS